MITFSDVLIQMASTKNPEFFLNLLIGNSNNYPVRSTTFYNDITVGGVTYFSDGKISSVSAPNISSVVDRSQYVVEVLDTGNILSEDIEMRFMGWDLQLWLGFTNSTDSDITDSDGNVVPPGFPILSKKDTVIVYAGIIESVSKVFSTETTGSTTLQISCSSPMHNLDFKRIFKIQKDFVRRKNPNDSSCDFMMIGTTNNRLLWGKRSGKDRSNVKSILGTF